MTQPSGARPLVPQPRTPVGDPVPPVTIPLQVDPARTVVRRLVGDVDVVAVHGDIGCALDELKGAVLKVLAGEPRAVVCDLSGTRGEPDAHAVATLAALGSYPRDWPAVPVAVVAPDERVRSGVLGHGIGGHLVVRESLQDALAALAPGPRSAVARLRLSPHPTAPRAARIFVARSCLDWSMTQGLAGVCLVTGELVTNAIVRTRHGIEVTLSRQGSLLRLRVRDHDSLVTAADDAAPERLRSRYVLVEGFSRAWGMMPAPGGGRIVWAVING